MVYFYRHLIQNMKSPKHIFLIILIAIFAQPLFAQNGEPKTEKKPKAVGIASVIKDTAFREEPPPPPPPPNSLEMVEIGMKKEARIDTTDWMIDAPPALEELQLPDTSAAPNDELTIEIRKMMSQTKSIEIGIQQGLAAMEEMKKTPVAELPEEFYERFKAELTSDSFKRILENYLINIYRKYLTVEDVKAITAFYETEAGKKAIEVMPKIMAESFQGGNVLGQMMGLKVFEELMEEGTIK